MKGQSSMDGVGTEDQYWVEGGRGKHDMILADIHRVVLDAEVQMTGGGSCTPDGWRRVCITGGGQGHILWSIGAKDGRKPEVCRMR